MSETPETKNNEQKQEPENQETTKEQNEKSVNPETANEQNEKPVNPETTEEKKTDQTPQDSQPEPVEEEKVYLLSELSDATEYDEEETVFMSKLYEETMQQIKSGEIIAGRIVSISDREVAIDIGFKSEGTVPIEEFEERDKLAIGDEVEVYLENIENQDGQLVLSKRKADFARVWREIMEIYERGETIMGTCIRRIKGGIVVDVKGIDAFLPGSQIDIHPVRDFDAWITKSSDFRIVKINEARKNIVISRKVLIEEKLRDVREQILSEIEIGQEIEGIVKNITDFGAFVDLGGVDGLLHITDLSWGRINHPSDIVSYDETIKVRILDFDPVRKRISVGLKQLYPHPWEGVEDRFPINSKVIGKVVSITKYGAFVELEEGIEGLVHISEMSWTQHIKHPSQILNIGQEIEIVVLSIDAENRKVSLGLKQTEEDPWEALEQKYAVDSVHKGIVRDLVPFGAFVELEEGVEGLVHISDLSWTRKVRHPGEIVKKGDEIDVCILSFDRNERRIALGHKQTVDNPWDQFEKEFPVGSLLDGAIVRTVDKGAIVELQWGLESFLPVSHFGKDSESGQARTIKEGDQLQVEIIDFDKNSKKIVVSASKIQKRAEEAEYREYLEEQKTQSESEAPAEPEEKTPDAEEPKAETSEAEPVKEEAEEAPKPEPEPTEAPAEEKEEKAEAEPAKEEAEEAPKSEAEPTEAPAEEEEVKSEAKAEKAEEKPKAKAKSKPAKASKEDTEEKAEAEKAEEKPKAKAKKKAPAKKKEKPAAAKDSDDKSEEPAKKSKKADKEEKPAKKTKPKAKKDASKEDSKKDKTEEKSDES